MCVLVCHDDVGPNIQWREHNNLYIITSSMFCKHLGNGDNQHERKRVPLKQP